MAAVQRLRQGFRALFAFSQPVDTTLAEAYLSPSLLALFRQMQRSEQLHSLNVLRAVLEQGDNPGDLAVAALLHDVGKIRFPLRLWQKTMAVLVKAFLPALYQAASHRSPASFWARPFVVNVQHPTWSGELVAAAGATQTAIWLITHHADSLTDWADHPHWLLLQRLQAADDSN